MVIITTSNFIINCDHVKLIKYGRNLDKYSIIAEPGGTITEVDTEDSAKRVMSYLFDKFIHNVPVDFRYLKW